MHIIAASGNFKKTTFQMYKEKQTCEESQVLPYKVTKQ